MLFVDLLVPTGESERFAGKIAVSADHRRETARNLVCLERYPLDGWGKIDARLFLTRQAHDLVARQDDVVSVAQHVNLPVTAHASVPVHQATPEQA